MADFIRGTINGNLTEIPGIGPKTAEKLAEGDDAEKVTNTYQLIGKVRECLFNECFFFSRSS
jgi:predicted flap endonuclease-1-like 5' DNA nuclease